MTKGVCGNNGATHSAQTHDAGSSKGPDTVAKSDGKPTDAEQDAAAARDEKGAEHAATFQRCGFGGGQGKVGDSKPKRRPRLSWLKIFPDIPS